MRAFFVFAALLVLGAAAYAAETITYSYDARGRLIAVAHAGGPSAGLTTSYTLDKADNRAAKFTNDVRFSIASNGAVIEGANSVFTVTKIGTAGGSHSVDYATANGTAAAPGDFTASSGTLTFLASETSKTVTVVTVDDTDSEPAETFTMALSRPTGGATIGTGTATATINDNEPK